MASIDLNNKVVQSFPLKDEEQCYSNEISKLTPKRRLFTSKSQQDYDQMETIPKFNYRRGELRFENSSPSRVTRKIDRKKLKKLWTKDEDQLLRHLVQTKGAKQWAFISNHFNNRCGKQCRQRWHNHLRTGIVKGSWDSDEQWILFLGVYAYGKRWSLISKLLSGRTENTLKNHWNCKMKPKKSKLYCRLRILLGKKQHDRLNLSEVEFKLLRDISLANKCQVSSFQRNKVQIMIQFYKRSLFQFQQTKKRLLGNNSHEQLMYDYHETPQKEQNFMEHQTFGKKSLMIDETNQKSEEKMKEEWMSEQKQNCLDQQSDYVIESEDDYEKEMQQVKQQDFYEEDSIEKILFNSPHRKITFEKIYLDESHTKK